MAEQELPYISAHEWVEVVSRLRFNSVETKVAPRTIKAIAFRLAWYADLVDGTRVYPGPARLAVVCEADYKTIKRALAVLRAVGLLTQVAYGRGPQGARGHSSDEYRLTIPDDLLDRVTVLSPLDVDREIERIREANRSPRARAVTGAPSPRNSYPQPVDGGELRGHQDPVTEHAETKVTGNSSPATGELRGKPVPSCGVIQSPLPTKDLPTTTTDHDPVPAQPPDAREPAAPNAPPRFGREHGPLALLAGVAS